MNDPWIRTHSGKRFHILRPHVDEIDIVDIAHGLSLLCRFTGQTKAFLSLAQHCCTVSDLLPVDLQLVGLLHDSSECWISDLNAPTKSILPQYKEIEYNIERVVSRKYGLQFPFPSQVKHCDMVALVSEFRWFMKRNQDWKSFPFKPLPKYEAWDSRRAEREFLKRFRRLYKR